MPPESNQLRMNLKYCRTCNLGHMPTPRPYFALAFSIALLVSGCFNEAQVEDVRFGAFSGVGKSAVEFRATTALSKSDGLHFGWLFSLRGQSGQVKVREVVEGPLGTRWKAPAGLPEVQVTNDGRTATVTRDFSDIRSPFAFHNWAISDSDPVGTYKASLYVNGKRVSDLTFEVGE